MMPHPNDRAALDDYILTLARLSDGFTLDDFRTHAIRNATRTAARVKRRIVFSASFFLTMTFLVLGAQIDPRMSSPATLMLSAAIWSFALGGLGAVASIFLHILRLMPQQTLNTSDEFEVFGRIAIGCLFSMILSITLVPDVANFLAALSDRHPASIPKAGPLALAPFLFGYSIPLVLRMLEKVIQAIEFAIGVEDRRTAASAQRGGARRTARRG